MGVRTIYLVRHGRTEWNAEQRMQGQLDSPLTKEGLKHARSTGEFLAEQNLDAVYASPLGRVRQTLDIIGEHVDLPVVFDARLMEWHCGEWGGTSYADLRKKWPQEWRAWEADRYNYRPPGAENFPDMIARAGEALDEIIASPHQRIAIVAHGLLNRALALQMVEFSEQEVLAIRQHNDVIFRVQLLEEPVIDHFVDGDGPFDGVPMWKGQATTA